MHENEESKISRLVSGLQQEIQDVVELWVYLFGKIGSPSHQGWITSFEEKFFKKYS